MSRRLSGCALALGAVVFGVQGCSSGGGDKVTGTNYTITLHLGSSSGSIAQGSSSQFSVSVARGGGYTGTLTFSVEGAPTGASGSASNVQTSSDGTSTSATITLTIGDAVATGSYPLTIRVKGSGVTDATATFSLTVTATGTASISLAAGSVSLAPSGSGPVTITISRSNYTGTVNLTARDLPTGVTVSFNPADVTGTTSTATVTVGASVAANTYNLTVKGSGTGVSDATTTIVLTVTAPAGFTLAALPTSLSIAQGAHAATTITVTRTGGFSGVIAFSASGLPGGVTATFDPTSTSGTSTSLTLTASGSATPGTFTVTATGTSGSTVAQTNVGLTITGGGGGGNLVTADFSACDPDQQPIWLAAQDGNGAWTMLTGTNHVYQYTLNSATGAYAYVTGSAGSFQISVQYGSKADLTNNTIVFCASVTTGSNTVTGTVAGLGLTDFASFGYGGVPATAFSFAPNVTFNHVPDGTWDLVGYRQSIGALSATDRAYAQRGIMASNGLSLGTLDFNGANSFAPMPATMTITNPGGGETLSAGLLYLTDAACHLATLWSATSLPATFTAYGFPAARQTATDYHGLFVQASTNTSYRADAESFHTFGDRSITLPALLSGVSVTTSGAAYTMAQVMFNAPTDLVAPFASLTYNDIGDAHQVTVGASGSVLSGATNTLATPDFSGVAGWNNSWAPPTGQTIEWSLDATSAAAIAGNQCTEGTTIRTTQLSGTK